MNGNRDKPALSQTTKGRGEGKESKDFKEVKSKAEEKKEEDEETKAEEEKR